MDKQSWVAKIQKSKRCLFEKDSGMTVLYGLFIGLAWCFALWDVSVVVQNYLDTNIVTQVVLAPTANMAGLPFLENVQVCVFYQNSIFEEIWWNDSTRVASLVSEAYDSPQEKNITRRVLGDLFDKWRIDPDYQLTKKEYIHAMKMLGMVMLLDSCQWLGDNAKSFRDSCQYEVFWDNLNFVRMKNKTEKLLREYSPDNNWTTIEAFDRNMLCQSIDPNEPIHLKKKAPFGFNLAPDRILGNNSLAERFKFSFPAVVEIAEFKTDYLFTTILIQPSGVSDIRKVEADCFNKDSIQRGILENCTDQDYVDAVGHYCRCVPYLFEKRKLSKGALLPYCTSQHYANGACMEEVGRAVRGSSCKNCLTAVNDYQIKYSDLKSDLSDSGKRAFEIRFSVPAKYYMRYVDDFKQTSQNIVAQIGGDIGFYTGFSLWSLWKFIMFFTSTHRHYRRKSKEQKNKNQQDKKISKINSAELATDEDKSLTTAVFVYLREGDTDIKSKILLEQNEILLKDRIRRLEEATMLLVTDLEMRKKKRGEEGNGDNVVRIDIES